MLRFSINYQRTPCKNPPAQHPLSSTPANSLPAAGPAAHHGGRKCKKHFCIPGKKTKLLSVHCVIIDVESKKESGESAESGRTGTALCTLWSTAGLRLRTSILWRKNRSFTFSRPAFPILFPQWAATFSVGIVRIISSLSIRICITEILRATDAPRNR